MVNVSNYNIVATDAADGNPDLVKCIQNYASVLRDNKNVKIDVDTSVAPEINTDSNTPENTPEDLTVTGVITDIRSQIENGSTCYYFAVQGAEKYIRVSADTTPEAIFFAKGDTITVKYQDADVDVNWINADTVEKAVAAE
jgi:hypothetical protein